MAFPNHDMEAQEDAGALDSAYAELHARDTERDEQLEGLRELLREVVADGIDDLPRPQQQTARQMASAPVSVWPPPASDAVRAFINGDRRAMRDLTVRCMWARDGGVVVAVSWDRDLVQRLRGIAGGTFRATDTTWHFGSAEAHRALKSVVADMSDPPIAVSRPAQRLLDESANGGVVDLVAAGTVWEVRLEYSRSVVDAIRHVPGALYDREAQTWSIPVTPATAAALLLLVEQEQLVPTPAAVAALVQGLPAAAQRHLHAATASARRMCEQLETARRLGAANALLAGVAESALSANEDLVQVTQSHLR